MGLIRTETEQVSGEKWLSLSGFPGETHVLMQGYEHSREIWSRGTRMSLSFSATLHLKIMHKEHSKIKVHQSRIGSKGMLKSSVKTTAWYTSFETP